MPHNFLGGRWVLGLAAGLLAGLVGCTHGSNHCGVEEDKGLLTQHGEVTLQPGAESTVTFPVAFVATPNLEIIAGATKCQVIEEKPNQFRLRNTSPNSVTYNWRARGQRYVQPPVVVTTPPPPPVQPVRQVKMTTPPGLPPQPIPYGK